MTEEQLSTIKERSSATIVITNTVEHEDGSATYTFDMDDASNKKMAELGIELILTCAAYGLYIQDALQVIADYGKEFGRGALVSDFTKLEALESRSILGQHDGTLPDEIEWPYTADEVGDILK